MVMALARDFLIHVKVQCGKMIFSVIKYMMLKLCIFCTWGGGGLFIVFFLYIAMVFSPRAGVSLVPDAHRVISS
jgi:hypothetical protein